MRQRHWMGTVWPWWADPRGISGLLWWIGKNSGRLSTHSCVFVCFIMRWPLACLWLWLQLCTTFPSHWPHSSGSSRTADSRNSEISGTAWKLSKKHESPWRAVREKCSDRHHIIWKCWIFFLSGCNCLGFTQSHKHFMKHIQSLVYFIISLMKGIFAKQRVSIICGCEYKKKSTTEKKSFGLQKVLFHKLHGTPTGADNCLCAGDAAKLCLCPFRDCVVIFQVPIAATVKLVTVSIYRKQSPRTKSWWKMSDDECLMESNVSAYQAFIK